MAVAPIKSDTEDKGLLTAEMVAKILMLNVSRVHQMGREGIIPREPGGKYRLVPAVQGYIRFLKKDNEDEDLISLSKEKARLTKCQRQKAELELGIARGEYIHVAEVERDVAEFSRKVLSMLEILPDRLERDADLLPGQVTCALAIVNSLRLDMWNRLEADYRKAKGTATASERNELEEIEDDDSD